MSATNTTPNIGLPSFIGTDKPAWLTDWNGAMSTIDTEVGSLKTDLSGDETRIGNLENSVSSLNTTVGNHTASITALNTQVSNQGGAINTITSLIGNGTPTTTDQTIIGAINELHSDIVNGWLIKDIHNVEVAKGSSATYADLAASGLAALNAYLASMPDEYHARITRVEIVGLNVLDPELMGTHYNNSSVLSEVGANNIHASANGTTMWSVNIASSPRIYKTVIDKTSGAITATNYAPTDALDAGISGIKFRLEIYAEIS